MHRFDSKCYFGHVKAGDVFGKYFILDEHCHQITTRKEFHQHVQECVVLERGVQLHHPRAIGLGKDVTLGTNVGKLIFLELFYYGQQCWAWRRKHQPFQT